MEIFVFGIRVTPNPHYRFAQFLQDLGMNKEHELEVFEDESKTEERAVRTLWMGYTDESQKQIAGLLSTPRKDKRYPVVESQDGTTRISLSELHRNAKELNFFVYSVEYDAMVYQYKHGSKGPAGFFQLLQPKYNAEKKELKESDKANVQGKGSVKASKIKEVNAKYKAPLTYSIMTTDYTIAEMAERMKYGKISIELDSPLNSSDDLGACITSSRTKLMFTLQKAEDKPGLLRRLWDEITKKDKSASFVGYDENDQSFDIDLTHDIAKSSLALATYEHEDWMTILSDKARFSAETFPLNSEGNLLPPVAALLGIMQQNKKALVRVP